jgi:hypothetical protein
MRIIHAAWACALAGFVLVPKPGEAAANCTAGMSVLTLGPFNQIRGTPPVSATVNVTVNYQSASQRTTYTVKFTSASGFVMTNASTGSTVSYTVTGPNGTAPTAVFSGAGGSSGNGSFTFPITITAAGSQDPKVSSTPYSDPTASLTCSIP